jgi:hypothetical protein
MGTGKATPPSGKFSQVSAGLTHSCGVRENGVLACWGEDEDGQSSPPPGEFTQVSVGSTHTCGVRADGTVACWGNNLDGQTVPPQGTFLWVSAGQFHNCGLRTGGGLDCWGAMGLGQAPRIYIGPQALPNGVLGFAYSQQFWSASGQAPYRFRVRSGQLPPGLSLDSETGLLSGMPTQTGTYGFSVLSTGFDRDFPLATVKRYDLTITEPGPTAAQIYLPLVRR